MKKILTATETRKLASDLGLTLTGNHKDGYKCLVSNSGSGEWFEITVTINPSDIYKTCCLLKGMEIIAKGTTDDMNRHWAIDRMITADHMIETCDNQYFIDYLGMSVDENDMFTYEDSQKDSWYQNEIDTTSWVFEDNKDMSNFDGTISEYVESLGEETGSEMSEEIIWE